MRLYLSWLMTFTFAFEPLLQARGSTFTEKWTAAEFEQHIKASSLGVKGKTYNDLYLFMKMNLPNRAADRFAELLLQNRDAKLPDIEFSKIITRDGHEGLKMILSANGLSHTVEIMNDDDVFAKIDGVALSIRDLNHVTPAVTKITAKYPNLIAKIAPTGIFKEDPIVVFNHQSKNSFYGSDFVVPTLQTWTSLPSIEQAKFIVELRRTWAASLEVENTVPTRSLLKPKNTAMFHPFFIRALLIQEAFAAAANLKCTERVPPVNDNSFCINSGYIGLIIKPPKGNSYCAHPLSLDPGQQKKISEKFSQKELPKEACSDDTYPCNTAIYGFERSTSISKAKGGKGICGVVNPGGVETIRDSKTKKVLKKTVIPESNQNATHYEGFCEMASPLDGQNAADGRRPDRSQMPQWMKDIKIDPGNVDQATRNKIREGFEADKANIKQNSIHMVASRLNISRDQLDAEMKNGSPKKAERDQQFLDSLVVFYQDINSKLAVCKANFQGDIAARVRKGEVCDYSTQLGACEQLLRRKLAMDYVSAQICPKYFVKDGRFNEESTDNIAGKNLNSKEDCFTAGGPPAPAAAARPTLAAAAAAAIQPAPAADPPPSQCPQDAVPAGMFIKAEGMTCFCFDTKDSSKVLAKQVGDKYTCDERKESSINPLIPLGIGAGIIALAALTRDRRKPANCVDKNAVKVGSNCYLPPVCDTVNYPEATLANKQCVLPTIPQKCYDGKVAVNGKCPCPENFKQMPNGTCKPGFACPYKNNIIVYDPIECSEGGTNTPNVPAPGGVGTQ